MGRTYVIGSFDEYTLEEVHILDGLVSKSSHEDIFPPTWPAPEAATRSRYMDTMSGMRHVALQRLSSSSEASPSRTLSHTSWLAWRSDDEIIDRERLQHFYIFNLCGTFKPNESYENQSSKKKKKKKMQCGKQACHGCAAPCEPAPGCPRRRRSPATVLSSCNERQAHSGPTTSRP